MQIKLPYPHAGQQGVRRLRRRFTWLSAGRRWRKTTLGMAIAVESAVTGQHIVWGAPTWKQANIAWEELREASNGNFNFQTVKQYVEVPNSGRIYVLSLDDPENARGYTADGAVFDEVGEIKESAFYDIVRPMLIDGGGWFFGQGTPKGRNWFWREHSRAVDREDSISFQIPTVGCRIKGGRRLVREENPLENPEIPFHEIADAFENMPVDSFRQEIMAEFLEGSGHVFRNISDSLWVPTTEQIREHSGHTIRCGVDWGKQNDYTVFSIVCSDCKKELVLDRDNHVEYAVLRRRLEAHHDRWDFDAVLAEENAMGLPLIEELHRSGLPVDGFKTTSASKPALIEDLILEFEKDEWLWLDNDIATSELEAYERTVNKHTGHPKYNAPKGMHDDTVIARALALRSAQYKPLVFL